MLREGIGDGTWMNNDVLLRVWSVLCGGIGSAAGRNRRIGS